ncbi:MAG: hypothetical protein V3V00_08685 [Saprospiraceae bacterium]
MKGILFCFTLYLMSFSQQLLFPNIILINGKANLVVLDELGFIVEVLRPVPYYFSSDLTHEEIVKGLIDQKNNDKETFYAHNEDRFISKSEVDVLDNAEFIKFMPKRALLNKVAVDRIRKISKDYLDGGIDQISLSIIYKNNVISELLTENRLKSVQDLLVAFGVDKTAIKKQKQLRNQYDNNPFVRVVYKKKVR